MPARSSVVKVEFLLEISKYWPTCESQGGSEYSVDGQGEGEGEGVMSTVLHCTGG